MRKPMMLLAVLLAVTADYSSIASAASIPAEQFVQQSADKAVVLLKDKSLGEADRRARVRDFLSSLLDLHRMALFTLGSAATSAPPGDVAAFVDAYTQFAIANYNSEFDAYGGQAVRVTNSIQRADNDFIVTADITDPATPNARPDLVSFRVLDEGGGKFAVVDASVEGVWFTVAQRDEYAAFLKQNGGNVAALTAKLRDMAAKLRGGEAQSSMQGK